jgi:hypothetical protein
MRTSSLAALTFPFALLLASPGASAQQPVDAATKSAARTVAEEALKLYDKGDYAGAYEKANRANELVHAPTMALLTGRCLEKLGRLVEASEKYLEASRATLEPNASAAQKSAQTEAEKARTALLPRIPSVELILDPPAPNARVTLDGKHVPPAMVGIKRPIDPGAHTVAVARGSESATQDFTLKEAEAVRVVLKAPSNGGGAGKPGGGYPGNPANPGGGYPGNPGGGYPGNAGGGYPGNPGKANGGYYPPPGGGMYQQPPVLMYPPGTVAVPPPPLMKRRSTGLFVTGIVFIPVGAVTAIVGALVLGASKSIEGSSDTFDGSSSSGAGAGILVVGSALLVGGIVMTVVGGKKVPVDPNEALLLDRDPRHSPPPPRASVTPLFGPVSGVRVQF